MCPKSPDEPPDCEPPDDLGLPEDYDPNRIPTQAELQHAALYALHREMSFVIVNRNDPERIADRLDVIASVARAASQIKGPHQAKAVRLGLALKLEYWLARDKVRDWIDLIAPLLSTSLEIEDHELQSEVYFAWSIFHYISRDLPRAQKALDAMLDYAGDADREDLQLLARADRFNLDVLRMSFDQALAEAEAIMAEAHRLDYRYVEGRAYLSLARICIKIERPKEIFAYAQQALVILNTFNATGLTGECICAMLGALSRGDNCTDHYRAQLLAYLEALAQKSVNPYFQASIFYNQAVRLYQYGEYDRAREFVLKAWLRYRIVNYEQCLTRALHMLGMIQAKRRRWCAAKRHLEAAYAQYVRTGEDVYAVHAKHALAYIPHEQGDSRGTLQELEEVVLPMAQALPDPATRDGLVALIEKDIRDIRQELSASVA